MRKGFTLIELMIVIAIIAIIAAIAIPNLLESRLTANEAAASASLKSGIMPSEIQFQAGGYQDRDADNVGEYGTLGALCGKDATTKFAAGQIKLLQGPLAAAAGAVAFAAGSTTRSANGFNFLAMIPSRIDGAGVGLDVYVEGDNMSGNPSLGATAGAMTALTAGETTNNGERYYGVGCAPEKFSDTGRRIFILSHDGQIRSPTNTGALAVWFNGAGSTVQPTTGQASNPAGIKAGIADAFQTTVVAGMSFSGDINPNYPTYSR